MSTTCATCRRRTWPTTCPTSMAAVPAVAGVWRSRRQGRSGSEFRHARRWRQRPRQSWWLGPRQHHGRVRQFDGFVVVHVAGHVIGLVHPDGLRQPAGSTGTGIGTTGGLAMVVSAVRRLQRYQRQWWQPPFVDHHGRRRAHHLGGCQQPGDGALPPLAVDGDRIRPSSASTPSRCRCRSRRASSR